MNQETLTFQLGDYSYDFTEPGVVRRSMSKSDNDILLMGTEYYINDETIADSFGLRIAPLLSDWLDVALACYLADRLSPRPRFKGDRVEQWSRNMNLKIGVRCTSTWRQPEVQRQFANLLNFLTDDIWRIQFIKRKAAGRLAERQGHLFRTRFSKSPTIALFSGGLDSFCGAARQVSEDRAQEFVFVSGVTNSRQRFAQRAQIRAISKHVGRDFYHLTIPFGFNWKGSFDDRIQEGSQRTRGFLFLTLGAVTALAAGSNDVRIFENGIGAINLPYDASQLGTANSRAVHPITLLRMSQFVGVLTGKLLGFSNPFVFMTKGEICQHPTIRALSKDISLTFSCDGFPVRHRKKPQCGSCTSCLLRRLSLEVSGLSKSDASEGYILDLLTPSTRASNKQLLPLRAMEWQAQKLRLLLKPQAEWGLLATQFPELQNIVSEVVVNGAADEHELRTSIVKLYAQYVSEWNMFSARSFIHLGRRAA